jgi:hypothetical protein
MENDKNNELLKPTEVAVQTETQPAEEICKADLCEFSPEKALMIIAMERYCGIVSYAAKYAGISRQTHYNWMASDNVYKTAIEKVSEAMLDIAEMRLCNYVVNADLKAIKFYLLTKGRKRGYSMHKQDNEPVAMPAVNIITRDEQQAALVRAALPDNGKSLKVG